MAPTTLTPTTTPSSQPTESPTIGLTLKPTTFQPSHNPSRQPTRRPTIGPTRHPSAVPTSSPSVACPVSGTLEFCGRFGTGRTCNNTKLTHGRCQWCLNACMPNMGKDSRVCKIPGFFSGCLAQCPSINMQKRCAPTLTKHKCSRKLCTFCRPLAGVHARCSPGKDLRVCSNPGLYAHCGTLAPTIPTTCPPKSYALRCLATTSQSACNKGCIWCPSVGSYPCRPTTTHLTPSAVCAPPGDPVFALFPKCHDLYPSPTSAPK